MTFFLYFKAISYQTGVTTHSTYRRTNEWMNEATNEMARGRDKISCDGFRCGHLALVFMYAETTCARNAYLNSNDDSSVVTPPGRLTCVNFLLFRGASTAIHITCCAAVDADRERVFISPTNVPICFYAEKFSLLLALNIHTANNLLHNAWLCLAGVRERDAWLRLLLSTDHCQMGDK